VIKMNIPKCCGKEMQLNVETSNFIEVQCKLCNDVVYLKKVAEKPQLLDD
jgi:hypothetical protein